MAGGPPSRSLIRGEGGCQRRDGPTDAAVLDSTPTPTAAERAQPPSPNPRRSTASTGSMLAPHVNLRATEYGVVLGGEGTIQVVFPNGSLAMSEVVRPGDVFWIPRYFPFCQMASRGGPFVFFGFTTSARRNRPQFLVGAASVLRTMLGPEIAAAFGVREEEFAKVVRKQGEALIMPSFPASEEEKHGKKGREEKHGKREKPLPLFVEQVA